MLDFALRQVTHGLGRHAGPSSHGERPDFARTSAGPQLVGAKFGAGDAALGLSAPLSADTAPYACPLPPPGATSPQLLESWEVEIWDATGVEDWGPPEHKSTCEVPILNTHGPKQPMSSSLHLDLQTSQ